ncbi:hypothetical protein J437_LFUL015232 [Ladona fulva]|uniref:Coiled-coil domain-containing protein n=1 Tax=Ladona fulva TaxID=123851 RepID=A0A8K0KND4_LADFU|nr:hypothetical protein J437_LFUL015232 [Ladona fulva]
MEEAAIMQALHEQMLHRQEEIDKQLAQQIAEKIEREEWSRRRAVEERDKEIAQQLQEKERIRLERLRDERERVELVQGANGPLVIPESSPDVDSLPRPPLLPHHVIHQQHSSPVQRAVHYSPKGVPSHSNHLAYTDEDITTELGAMDLGAGARCHGHYPPRESAEFYQSGSSSLVDEQLEFSLNNIAVANSEEARRMQEEQDAELARLLQEQEGKRGGGKFAMDPLDRDRLLAVEAQDRELARMLQERERAKARRARERGKQRALLKKQQQLREQQMLEGTPVDGNEDDEEPEYGTVVSNGTDNEGEDQPKGTLEQRLPASHGPGGSGGRADRPTDLDLTGSKGRRSSTGVKAKPRQRFPDPEAIEVLPPVGLADSPSIGSSRCANIAMAIDPTYPRRANPASPPSPAVSSLSRGSSPAVASGICSGSASSSPGISLPPPDFEEDDSPAPPYMPIQGQRRTSSLEKKGKKGKQKDGCRQQ